MRVVLIFPKLPDPIVDGSLKSVEKNTWFSDLMKKRLFGFGETNYIPPMALLALGAVTPSDVDLRIIDERLEPIDTDMAADLVGISAITLSAYRAYEIAARFRRRGVKVVLGGIHPTVLPQEALQHADAVVVGEGDAVWPRLLEDAADNRLRPCYQAEAPVDLATLPPPRMELLSQPDRYLTTKIVRATRGCPNFCTFCTVGAANSRTYRIRPVQDVVAEISAHPGRNMFFLDDNLGGDPGWAKALFAAIKPLGVTWYAAVSINALEDPSFIRCAAEAGCVSFGIGFESLSEATLKRMGKRRSNNPARYPDVIKKAHDHGIAIVGYFIMGYDSDTAADYERLGDFILDTGLDIPSISALTPYPGSPVFRKLSRQGRIRHHQWDLYYDRWWDLVYRPRNMTQAQIYQCHLEMSRRIFSLPAVVKRSLPHVFKRSPFGFTYTLQHGVCQHRELAAERARGEFIGRRQAVPSVP
jgi:radical SAM superfamily enzyme YgiQ (UPF0313 family)